MQQSRNHFFQIPGVSGIFRKSGSADYRHAGCPDVLTSYYYAKESGIKTVWFPKGFFELDINDNDLSTWIDVDGDGEKEIFVGILKYSVKNNTAQNAPNSDFQFLKRNKRGKDAKGKIYDSYYPENTLIDGKGKGCIHPRKGVVNDFNLDGKKP